MKLSVVYASAVFLAVFVCVSCRRHRDGTECKLSKKCKNEDGLIGTCSQTGCKTGEKEVANGCRTKDCICCVKDNMLSAAALSFILEFNKTYATNEEYIKRIAIFEENSRAIEEHNKLYVLGKSSYTMGVNEFSDMTYDEILSSLTGLNASASVLLRQSTDWYVPKDLGKEPSYLDYRTKGAVNPVRNQVGCGSCWAFSTIASIESIFFLKKGSLPTFSEQDLVDCSEGSCQGWWPEYAIKHIATNGIANGDDYPYTASDDICNEAVSRSSPVKGHKKVQEGKEDELLNAVVHIGPISIAYYVSNNFGSYKSGIFFDDNCVDKNYWVNHAMTLVGYGTENGQDYWLIRNSWGTSWGDQGYIKVARNKDNHCGIASYADIPDIEVTESCSDGFFNLKGSQKCYRLYDDAPRTWAEAKDKCEAEGLMMAEPYDIDPVALAMHMKEAYGADDCTSYWLGAQGNGEHLMWQSGQEVADTTSLFWHGYSDYYKDGVPNDRCLGLLTYSFITQYNDDRPYHALCCEIKLYSLCEVPTAGCPAGYFQVENSSKCFKMYADARSTWDEANDTCESEGLRLAHPQDPIALRLHLVEDLGIDYYTWLGAQGDNTSFVWQNGEMLYIDSPYWYPGTTESAMSDTRCLGLDSTAYYLEHNPNTPYYSWPCTSQLSVLCEM